jgi:hypothetical protein
MPVESEDSSFERRDCSVEEAMVKREKKKKCEKMEVRVRA